MDQTIFSPVKPYLLVAAIVIGAAPLGGCVLALAGAAGYIVADEVKEGDGVFDPLEEVRGVENESN